ncbi:hypothetical protein CsSME_00024349 [Camellia sinensis var. sinensis]
MEVGEVVQSTSINTQKISRINNFPQDFCSASIQECRISELPAVSLQYSFRCGGSNAIFYTNLAGGTESNVFDIVQELEDLGSSHVFLGASDINGSLSGSGVVQEIAQYICEAKEILFVYLILGFLVIKDRKPTQSFAQVGKSRPSEHIPVWLPAFPDPQTYSHSPSWNEREVDT